MLVAAAIDVSLTITCPAVALQRHEAKLISTSSLQISRRRTACSRPCHEYGGQQLPQPLGKAVCTHLKHSPPSHSMFHASAGGSRVCCASTVPRCAAMVILIDTACARLEQRRAAFELCFCCSPCRFGPRRLLRSQGPTGQLAHLDRATCPPSYATGLLCAHWSLAAGRGSSASKSVSNAARIPPSTTWPRSSRSCSSARQFCT